MGSNERGWYTLLGIVGYVARGVVFALIGVFLVRAAWDYDPKEAVGYDGALSKLQQAPYTAAGLVAFGLFCLVQARYREV